MCRAAQDALVKQHPDTLRREKNGFRSCEMRASFSVSMILKDKERVRLFVFFFASGMTDESCGPNGMIFAMRGISAARPCGGRNRPHHFREFCR